MTLSNTIAAAARNVWALTVGDGVEDPAPTPSVVVYDELHRTLLRFMPDAPSSGRPVLLVPPLAVSLSCYDLRPGQSLARHLTDQGRPTYVVDYGDITFADRRMGFEDWVDDIVPKAVQRVSDEHDGAAVDIVGWSLGGTLSYLTVAGHPELPVASITAIGTPVDYSQLPGAALLQWLSRVAGDTALTLPAMAMGGMPRALVRAGFRATALRREVTKPLFIARNLADTQALARMESVDRFMGEMPGYPGRLYLQLQSRLVQRNELAHGVVNLSRNRVLSLAMITVPVLVVGSRTDAIAPAAAVRAAVDVLVNAPVRYAEVTGSHLGMLAGPEAPSSTWAVMDDFHASL